MTLAIPGIGTLGWPELVIVLLVVLLIFGGKKLPEIARGTGRALRIFKSETKGLMHEDDTGDDDAAAAGTAATADTTDNTDTDDTARHSSAPPQIAGSPNGQHGYPDTKPAADPDRQTGS